MKTQFCDNCKEGIRTCDVGECKECGAPTSSGSLHLCPKCAKKSGVCQGCEQPLPNGKSGGKNV